MVSIHSVMWKGVLGFSWCSRGQKKQGPNYFGRERSEAFGQGNRASSYWLRGQLLHTLVPRSYRPSFFIPRSLSSPSTTPITTFLQLLFINQHHFCSFLICYLFCLVNSSPWSHTLATSFVVVWSKLQACPSSSVVMAKIRSQLKFLRGAPSFWLGLSSSSLSSPAL